MAKLELDLFVGPGADNLRELPQEERITDDKPDVSAVDLQHPAKPPGSGKVRDSRLNICHSVRKMQTGRL